MKIKNKGITVTGLMRQSAKYNANRISIVAGDRSLTYAEAWNRGVRLANGFLSVGLSSGDRVAVLEDNSIEAQDFFLGSAIAGLVRVPLYARNSVESHAHMINQTGARAVIVSKKYESELREAMAVTKTVNHLIVRDESYEDWLNGFSEIESSICIDPDDWYIIRHTGGTTGKAKGVAYSHKTWINAGRDWFYNFPPMTAGDVCLHVGPISHGSGYLFTPTWLSGGVNLLLTEFDPDKVLEVMDREKVAYMFLVPSMLNSLVRCSSAKNTELPFLKVIQIGGAPIADETALLGREVFGDVLYQGYGQTEALPVCMMGPHEWFSSVEGSNPLRSAGRALPFAYLEIRDTNDPEINLPMGEEGEIAIKCDGQMIEFWENKEATDERISSDGFVLTGDIGKLDENGYLYVLDRKDDMIISGGFNIWPAELENIILNHPEVSEVAVFAGPHEKWGETPIAVCVIPENVEVTELEIITLCSDGLGSYKKPTKVIFQTESLPKSPVGKVQRKILREPFWDKDARRVKGA
jgi:acyl-CoA synthetase (AMP-forming)/AMP-acid ligase II